MRDAYLLALAGVNACFLVVALSNVLYLRQATKAPRTTGGPFVSVIVPVRNEERAVARCLESLLAQDYEDYEVIVVDDSSQDSTASIVESLAARDPRLQLIRAKPLPDGWLGKPHALAEGEATARGEILLLTDADTTHSARSVSWAVTNMQAHRADILSGYLDQRYGSLGESIVVPTMYAMLLLVPLFLLPRTKSPGPSFAIGQYVAMRREALVAVGGFESIKDSIVDDMAMAARMKDFGYTGVFLDATQAARCRLYDGYVDAFAGIERSVYSALGANPFGVAVVIAVVLAVIVWPAFAVLASLARLVAPDRAAAFPVLLFTLQWGVISWDRKVPFAAFALYPLVFLNLLLMMIASMFTTGFGAGVAWKGRKVRVPAGRGLLRQALAAVTGGRSGRAK
jgi:chlorobactene glucosyltransferase